MRVKSFHSPPNPEIMKNTLLKFAGALLLGASLISTAVAVPINGAISFNGLPTFNATPISGATAFTAFGSVQVQTGSQFGSYAGIPNDYTPVTFTPFVFSPPAGTVTPLWTLTFGGLTYSFDATSMTSSFNSANNIWNIGGNGIAHITGFTDTAGTWNLHAGNEGSSFTFGSSTNVPDGGTTSMLLGMALLGLGFIARRKFV
jgi:hypothetical protein